MASFPAVNYENEIVRVLGLWQRFGLPPEFGLTINDHQLIRSYLYHFVQRHFGLFINTPILHLHHDELPLTSPRDWDIRLRTIFRVNGAILIVTDGDFRPNSRVWYRFGEAEVRPVFPDSHIEFSKMCYYSIAAGSRRRTGYFLEVFRAHTKENVNPENYSLNFKMIKISFPTYEYRYRRHKRNPNALELTMNYSDPPYAYGPPPTPFNELLPDNEAQND